MLMDQERSISVEKTRTWQTLIFIVDLRVFSVFVFSNSHDSRHNTHSRFYLVSLAEFTSFCFPAILFLQPQSFLGKYKCRQLGDAVVSSSSTLKQQGCWFNSWTWSLSVWSLFPQSSHSKVSKEPVDNIEVTIKRKNISMLSVNK